MTAVQADRERPVPAGLLGGKVVLVAGVGPDLGRSLALRSAGAGADVVLAARSSERLEKVAAEVTELGCRALPVPTDVSDAEARARLVSTATAEFGGVDVLLNSAFVQPPQEPLLDADLERMRRHSDLNVLASVGLVQALAPTLGDRHGSVVLVNSMVIRNRLPNFGAYRMDKAALLAAARSLSVELGPRGVRVNSVAPGTTMSERIERLMSEEEIERTARLSPLHAIGMPTDTAHATVFLLSAAAGWLTGVTLDVNGGRAML